jgi:hypothetical protein
MRLSAVGSGVCRNKLKSCTHVDVPEAKPPRISQEMLADTVSTTRSRVNFFMNKFRRLGMIGYSGKVDDNLVVYTSLA